MASDPEIDQQSELATASFSDQATQRSNASGAQAVGDSFDLSHPLAQDLLLNPSHWRIWPAVAVLRWLLRGAKASTLRGLVYRSKPTLQFTNAEIEDVAFVEGRVELILSAPGFAAPGSSLPTVDIARIVADSRPPGRGALSAWLDGFSDCFLQAVETAKVRDNAAFALAVGQDIEALRLVARIAGHTVPLGARPGGELFAPPMNEQAGALGLAPLFVGRASAVGLKALAEAFTCFPVSVEEFAGQRVAILRPAVLGGIIGHILGFSCWMSAAGIELVIEGGSDPSAREWVLNSAKRRSLQQLCESYIGSQSPALRMFMTLEPDNAPPARLDRLAEFGGLAILGRAERSVRLPLAVLSDS